MSVTDNRPATTLEALIPSELEAFSRLSGLLRPWAQIKASIESSLIEHLHVTIVALARASEPVTGGSHGYWDLLTTDRFGSAATPRKDLVERIALGLGGRRTLADAIVAVIENRMDLLLSLHGEVAIEGIGAIRPFGELVRDRQPIGDPFALGEGTGVEWWTSHARSLTRWFELARRRRSVLETMDYIRVHAMHRQARPYLLHIPQLIPGESHSPEVIKAVFKHRNVDTAAFS